MNFFLQRKILREVNHTYLDHTNSEEGLSTDILCGGILKVICQVLFQRTCAPLLKDDRSTIIYRSLKNFYWVLITSLRLGELLYPSTLKRLLTLKTRLEKCGNGTFWVQVEFLGTSDRLHNHYKFSALVEGSTHTRPT